MKVAIYARISTTDQKLDSQLLALRDYAKARGFEIVETFSDKGVSGTKTSRPALDRLMNAARKRKFEAVLVFRFDRFARSTKHLADALEEFKNLGVQFISYSENIDTGSPMGAAMFSIISAMAQLERDILIDRVNAGIAAAQAAGIRCGRKYEVDPTAILGLRAEGHSTRAIAKALGCSKGAVYRALK